MVFVKIELIKFRPGSIYTKLDWSCFSFIFSVNELDSEWSLVVIQANVHSHVLYTIFMSHQGSHSGTFFVWAVLVFPHNNFVWKFRVILCRCSRKKDMMCHFASGITAPYSRVQSSDRMQPLKLLRWPQLWIRLMLHSHGIRQTVRQTNLSEWEQGGKIERMPVRQCHQKLNYFNFLPSPTTKFTTGCNSSNASQSILLIVFDTTSP